MTEDSSAVERSTLARWKWSVAAAFALGGVTVAAWGPRLPAIMARLGIDTAAIGLLLAGVTVGAIAGLLLSATVVHRFGSRRSVAIALLIISGAMALLALSLDAKSIPVLVIGFLAVGAGIGMLDAMINVEGAAVERALGRTLMPRLHAAWSIGVAVGSGIGAAAAALGVGPAAQFLGEATAVAVAALASAPGIPIGRRLAVVRDSRTRLVQLREWLKRWLDWRLLLIGVVMLGVELGEGSANSWLTLAVRDDHGQSAAVAALFFGAFAAGEALTRVFGAPVVDRLGRVRTIRATTAVGVIGVSLFILSGNPWLALLGTLLWAVGVSMGFPLGMSAAAESGPDPVARVSVVGSLGYVANLAGPPVIGVLAERVGLADALFVVAVMFAVAFAVAGSLGRSPSHVPDGSAPD